MKISALALTLLTACGGARPRRDPCADYASSMRAPLAKLERAADAFAAQGPGDARGLAARLAEIRAELARTEIDRADLRSAHGELVAALADMSHALEVLGEVLEAHDDGRRVEASQGLRRASRRWGEAVAGVRGICPGIR